MAWCHRGTRPGRFVTARRYSPLSDQPIFKPMSMRLAVFTGGYVLIAGLVAVTLGVAFRYNRLRRSCSVADYEARQQAAEAARGPEATAGASARV